MSNMHHMTLYYYKADDVNYTNFGIDLYITESERYRLVLNTTGVIYKMTFEHDIETSKDKWISTTIWEIT